MTAVDEIKSRIDIVDLVSEAVKLRRAGKNYTGFCPFHPNSRTPAFVVFPDSGTWRCFGQCNEGGDIFKYVMKKEGWDFTQTLRHLAQRAGVALEPPTPQRQQADEHQERLRALLEDAATFYRHHLHSTPAGKQALDYLHQRGLQDQTIQDFGLGYGPDSWDAASKYFTEKSYTTEELLQAGLVTERQAGGGVYDRFRQRIIFPIRDGMGRMTGFGARILNPEDVPKFINSPQTELFDKGRLLYGLDLARKAIRAANQVVIVEGYLDVIALHQAGYPATVSPMGTALTEDQLRLLKRFTPRIVLALDADAAGQKATLRGLEVARQALDHQDELVFDARGLLHHEARLQADLRVTTLPEGMDPDEVALRDPEEWGRILVAARPIVIHVMETLASGSNLDDPKVKSAIAAQVLPLIEDVPSLVERDAYRQRLARLLKIDERTLVGGDARPARSSQSSRRARTRESQQPPALAGVTINRAHEMEVHCLRLLLRQPEALYLVDRSLQEVELNRFNPQDFDHTDHQLLARLVQQSLDQDENDPGEFILKNVSGTIEQLVQELLAPMSMGEPTAQNLLEDLLQTVIHLRRNRINEGLNQLRFLQEQNPQQAGDVPFEGYLELVRDYGKTRQRLDQLSGGRQIGLI